MNLTKAQFELFEELLKRNATIFYWDSQGGSASLVWQGMDNTDYVHVRVITLKALEKNGLIQLLPPSKEVQYYINNYSYLNPRHYGVTEKGWKAHVDYLEKKE